MKILGHAVSIILNGDGALLDWADRPMHWIRDGIRAVRLHDGTESGKAAVSFAALLPNGDAVVFEMTETTFEAIAAAFRGRKQFEEENTPVVDEENLS